MTKKELLDAFQEALKTEESIIPLITKHIDSTLFLSGLDQEVQGRIKEILEKLRSESTGHGQTYKQLIKTVKEDNRDVY